MAGPAPPADKVMSLFDQLVERVRTRFGDDPKLHVSVDEPVKPDGIHFLSIGRDDDYVVEIEWQRHRGFGIAAGHAMTFGSGVDEIRPSVDQAFERVAQLIETGEGTSIEARLDLSDLRKVRGLLQTEVAHRLGISKSGLAQMEKASAIRSMQVDTLSRVIASLGGELVLTARFPDGRERRIASD
jgi:DNA-binding XRE family transcriptional regulator